MVDDTVPPVDPAKTWIDDWAQVKALTDLGGDTSALVNLSRERGNDLTENNQIIKDRDTMDGRDFIKKYGYAVSDKLDELEISRDRLDQTKLTDRDIATRTADAVVGFGDTINNSLAGLGAFVLNATPAGPVSEGLGLPNPALMLSEAANKYSKDRQETQSDALKQARKLDSMRSQLDNMDINNLYEEERKTEGDFVAGLRSVGRDVIKGAGRLVESPEILEQGVVGAAGSIAAAAVTGGLVGAGAKALIPAIPGAAAVPVALTASETAAMIPLTVGAMEGGGAYAQTAQKILDTPFDKLEKTSPEYNELIKTLSPEDARAKLADTGGKIALAIQTPAAMVTGGLVAKFEANPLNVPSIRDAVTNVGREFLEEFIQSGTGELAQNTGIKATSDNTQAITENLGSSAIQGGIFGAASASAIQAPKVINDTAADLLKAGVNKVTSAINDASNRVSENNLKEVGLDDASITQATVTAAETAPAVAQTITETLAANPPSKEVGDVATRIQEGAQISKEELRSLGSQVIRLLPSTEDVDFTNRFSVLKEVAKIAGDESQAVEDRTAAATFLLEQYEKQDELFNKDLPAALENVPQDSEEYKQIKGYSGLVNVIPSIGTISEAMSWAKEQLNKVATEEVTPITATNINTPSGQQTLTNTINLARVSPSSINTDIAASALLHSDKSDTKLTPEQRQSIENSVSLVQAGKTYNDTMVEQEKAVDPDYVNERVNIVSEQIAKKDGPQPYQYSLETHIKNINKGVLDANKPATALALRNLALFARHMRNKTAALNDSFKNGGTSVPYQTLGANHEWVSPKDYGKLTVHPSNAGSKAFARRVFAEAKAAVTLANEMAAKYPEYNIAQIPVVTINKGLLAPNAAKAEPVKKEAVQEASTNPAEAPVVETPVEPVTPATDAPSEPVTDPKQLEFDLRNKGALTQKVIEDEAAERAAKAERRAAIVEDNRTEESEVIETDNLTVENQFPKLMKTEEKGWFARAFNFPRKPSSRMFELLKPLDMLADLINEPKDLMDFIGNDVDYSVSRENLDSYLHLLALGKRVRNSVITNTANALKEKDSALIKQLQAGTNIGSFVRGRMLNIVEFSDTGFKYNPQLLETAIIAAMNWVVNAQQATYPMTKDEVAEQLGQDDVTNAQVEAFNRGMSMDRAKQSLGEEIVRFWGLRANKNTDIRFTKGIQEGLAAQIIESLAELNNSGNTIGLIELSTIWNTDRSKSFNRINFDNRSPFANDILTGLNGAKNLLTDIAVIDNTPTGIHFGKPPKAIAQKQLRNSLVNNTRQQKKAMANLQNTPFKPNMMMHDFIKMMGGDLFVELMGGINYKPGTLNINHQASVDGKNRTLRTSFDNVLGHIEEIASRAEKADIPIDDFETFFEVNITRVGRFQMMGLNNPVSDKLAREILMPTRTVLDMSDPSGSNVEAFWATVGQGLGIKTEYTSNADIKAQTIAMTMAEGGKYTDIITDIQEWLLDTSKPFNAELNNKIKALIPNKDNEAMTLHGIHGLLAVAKYKNALESKDTKALTEFVHFGYLEADGKTNGPINSLLLFTNGDFTADWLKNTAKGGSFIGNTTKTLDQHFNNVDNKDLYSEGSDQLIRNNGYMIERFAEGTGDQYTAFLRVMQALNVNVSFTQNENGNIELKVKRGFTKNPLTITIYGSGKDGIAGNITDDLVEAIYQLNTDLIKEGTNPILNDKQFKADLNKLFINVPKIDPKTNDIVTAEVRYPVANTTKNNAKDYTINKSEYDALKTNVKIFMVNQLDDAIRGTIMGQSVTNATVALQKATQIQSIVLKTMWNNEAYARLLNKRKELNDPNAFLSQAELDQINVDLMAYSPVISTGTQSYYFAGQEQSEPFKTGTEEVDGKKLKIGVPDSWSRTLSDKLSSLAYIYSPALAGVKAIPGLVIGSGDGQMMLNALTVPDRPTKALPVFDGMLLAVDQITSGSMVMNRAVRDTWLQNPMRNVYDSFAEFMRNDPLAKVNSKDNRFKDDFLLEMSKVYLGTFDPKEIISMEDAQIEMRNVLTELKNIADSIDARQDVLKDVSWGIDQMAGGKTPFIQNGSIEIPEGASDSDIVAILNRELAKRSLIVAKPQTNVADALVKHGYADTDNALTILNLDMFAKVFKDIKSELTTNNKEIITASLKLLKDSGYNIIFGKQEDINKYEANNLPTRYNPNLLDYNGKIDLDVKQIYITTANIETITHELIHAATIDKVRLFFAGSDKLSQADREAIGRIQVLMNEWLVQNYDNESTGAQSAYGQAVAAILGHRNAKRPAEALNEFMAWSLSNQDIIEVQKRTKVKNPLGRILGEALKAIKVLIWGSEKATGPNSTMFSNLRFNTRILMATATVKDTLISDMSSVALYQSPSFGSDQRLTDLRTKFANKVSAYLTNGSNDAIKMQINGKIQSAMIAAEKLTDSFMSHGFNMNMQQKSTFQTIASTLALETELNSVSLSRIQDIYNHVTENLKVEDLMNNPTNNDPNDRYLAQEKFNVINGNYLTQTDALGRSSLLPSFLALAMVDDKFRKVLNDMPKPKALKESEGTVDGYLDDLGSAAMDSLAVIASGEGRKNKDILSALDALTDSLIEKTGDQRTFIEQYTTGTIDKIDEILMNQMENLSSKGVALGKSIAANTSNKYVEFGGKAVAAIASLINEDNATHTVSAFTNALNSDKISRTLREFFAQITGRTDENAPIFDMISKVRYHVDQARQVFREKLPVHLASKFTRDLTSDEWSHATLVLAKSDLAALHDTYGTAGSLKMVTDAAARRDAIKKLETAIKAVNPARYLMINTKANQLANYMVSGMHGDHLLRNAHAIAHLYGMNSRVKDEEVALIENNINQLVTLYALDLVPKDIMESMSNLITNEKAGMEYTHSYLVGTAKQEMSKNKSTIANNNYYKGHIRTLNQEGVSFVVAPIKEHARYKSMGYTQTGPYTGSSADFRRGQMNYYFAPVSGRAKYNQGVMQTVHQTVSGINPNDGYTADEMVAGRIVDPLEVATITRALKRAVPTDENLLPVFSGSGQVVAYERAVSPKELFRLNRNDNLSQMLGVWRGRQVEERMAAEMNNAVVDNLYDIYQKDKSINARKYVNIAKSTDPVELEAWNLIPEGTKQYIQQVFGKDTLYIRRDMINDAVGFRAASIGDSWTGNTRWKPAFQNELKKAAITIFGNEAYAKLVNGEKLIQDFVTDAKVLIVIKSVIVPMANIIANMYQLSTNGIPARDIIKGIADKTTEINDYIKRRDKEIKLEADLAASTNIVETRKLENQIRAIKDSYKRMSIYPLIEAGEFSAISEGGLSKEDIALANGKWANIVDAIADKVPEGLKTPYRYAVVTRDTSLFKGLAKATQYGDFVAKAIMYDDNIKRKGMTSTEAIADISEEFINYNRLAGRSQNYGESMGLLWFWNFKLRAMKIATRTLRRHPFRALLFMNMVPNLPGLGEIGSPLTDSGYSVALDGRLGNSIGPGMLFRAPALNPWYNLFN